MMDIEQLVKVGRNMMKLKEIVRVEMKLVTQTGTEISYNSDKDKGGDYEVFLKKKGEVKHYQSKAV